MNSGTLSRNRALYFALLVVILYVGLIFRGSRQRSDAHVDGMGPQFVEFPDVILHQLPATKLTVEQRAKMPPWIAGFVGLNSQEATQRLHDRWAPIQRPVLRDLRETLSKFEVQAVVEVGSQWFIFACRPNANVHITGNMYYLPAPIDAQKLETRLTSVGLEKNDALREFMTYFGGLEEYPTAGGCFVSGDEPWETFTDSWNGTIQGFEEWQNSLFLFQALNGCNVMVHRDGRVAWWLMQEHRVVQPWANFDAFVVDFNEHRKIAWPFDPYGPPDARDREWLRH